MIIGGTFTLDSCGLDYKGSKRYFYSSEENDYNDTDALNISASMLTWLWKLPH